MKRICPNCKSVLSMSSVYFCENCGNVLPEDMQLDSDGHKNVKKIKPKKKKCEKIKIIRERLLHFASLISMRSVVLGFVLGIMVSLLVFLFFETESFVYVSKIFKGRTSVTLEISQTQNTMKSEPTVESEDPVELGLGLDLRSGPFGQYSVKDLVPYDASFYMEFNDPSTLEPYFGFLGGDLFTLNENVRENIHPFYAAFYMTKGIKSGWVILTFLNDESLDVGTYNNIFTDKIDNTLIISSELVLIDEVKLAKSEVVKNLSMHPSLISMKPFMPDSGQVLLIKVKKDGNDVIEKLEEDTTSEDFKFILGSYMGAESPYLAIK